jgi:hypothetical protein
MLRPALSCVGPTLATESETLCNLSARLNLGQNKIERRKNDNLQQAH